MKITEVMTSNVVTAGPDASISDIARLLTEKRISGVPIVDSGRKVLGMITERDLLPKMKGVPFSTVRLPTLFGEWLGEQEFEQAMADAKERKAADVMTTDIITIDENEELSQAAALMAQHSVKRLPVIRDGVLVGIITRADIIRAIA